MSKARSAGQSVPSLFTSDGQLETEIKALSKSVIVMQQLQLLNGS